MAITYVKNVGRRYKGLKIPILHHVQPPRDMTLEGHIKGYKHGFIEMHDWCKENCKAPFYSHMRDRWAFEDSEDAVMFALRWS